LSLSRRSFPFQAKIAKLIVALTVLVMRRTHPAAPRPFRTLLVPFVPLLCMLFCLTLITVLPKVTILRFVIWLAAGLAVYFLYGKRHSVLGSASPVRSDG
jgi:APA family basic amino acid/polyamine antiporter